MYKTIPIAFLLTSLIACGPTAEQRAAIEKAHQDSITKLETEQAAHREQARKDSIEFFEKEIQVCD